MPCSSGGTGETRRCPWGAGWPRIEDHESVLRAVIRPGWPDREPTWPAFLEGGAALRVTDAEANNWLPEALRTALTHWATAGQSRQCRSPSPHTSSGAGDGRARRRSSEAVGQRGMGKDQRRRTPPQQARAPLPRALAPPPSR